MMRKKAAGHWTRTSRGHDSRMRLSESCSTQRPRTVVVFLEVHNKSDRSERDEETKSRGVAGLPVTWLRP